jgi:menaquinone-9 beta-reductase
MDAEVVIVGAGVAGAALATALARNNISVLVLEKTLVHRDRVRGEWIPPWGVVEAQKLGILDLLTAAGGHYVTRHVPYCEELSLDSARANAIDLGKLIPDVRGVLTLGHPQICEALDNGARAAGATLMRGVSDLIVTPGNPPKVTFAVGGTNHEVIPRLVVGADGRGSSVARQIGARVETDPTHHIMAGLLVTGAEAWPDDEETIGVDGDVLYFVFPQGSGRIRLYLGYGLSSRARFAGGENNGQRFLEALRLQSLPHSEALAGAQPAGPCHGYPNEDTWIDEPVAGGVVLIGDAAGHNDPTLGQGLSIAFRDALLVTETLAGTTDWTPNAFRHYAAERKERMRRLRFVGRLTAAYRVEFGEAARARRQRAMGRIAADPSLHLPVVATLKGPFGVPASAFEQSAWDRLLN